MDSIAGLKMLSEVVSFIHVMHRCYRDPQVRIDRQFDV